jgi:purine-nucleoside phosphorylase
MLQQILQASNYLQQRFSAPIESGIILGSGLGNLVTEIDIETIIPYQEIPGFPISTVAGHNGQLIYGMLGNKRVLAMQGRFHYYEGYNMKQVTFPVRVMKALGIKNLFISNAAGGMNENFEIGELMVINDHINFFPENPLHGKNEPSLGVRFPDMSAVYHQPWIEKAFEIAKTNHIKLSQGVYIGVSGPTLETPAEYRMLKILGADAVGMSTVPEVIVAIHSGMKVFAISIITDLGVQGKIVKVTHEDVVRVAAAQEPKMTVIMKELINTID